MPNQTFRRWTADDMAKLKNMAQKQRPADIAAQPGRSVSATAVKAHQLNVSLRVPRQGDSEVSPTNDLAPLSHK
jgi:hypothetical protein